MRAWITWQTYRWVIRVHPHPYIHSEKSINQNIMYFADRECVRTWRNLYRYTPLARRFGSPQQLCAPSAIQKFPRWRSPTDLLHSEYKLVLVTSGWIKNPNFVFNAFYWTNSRTYRHAFAASSQTRGQICTNRSSTDSVYRFVYTAVLVLTLGRLCIYCSMPVNNEWWQVAPWSSSRCGSCSSWRR